MSKPMRITIVLAGVLLAFGLVVFAAMAFIRSSPPSVDFTAKSGQPVNLTIQTVGSVGYGVHPSWVSYLVQDPSGSWVHTTLWKLPAHTKVNVTIYEFDSGSPLRNPAIGAVAGVTNPELNAKSYSLVDATQGNGVAHTFSVPQLGINVPLPAVDPNAKTFCSTSAPCATSGSQAAEHNLITFSFTTPGSGMYRWQCFIPCGLGFLYGNGGPMQTVGYMDGFLEVQ